MAWKTKSWLNANQKNVIHLVLPKGKSIEAVGNENTIAKEVLEQNQKQNGRRGKAC